MKTKWNLKDLYASFDKAFLHDLQKIQEYGHQIRVLANHRTISDLEKLEQYIELSNALEDLVEKTSSFVSLTLSEDTTNQEALRYSDKIDQILVELVEDQVKIQKWIATLNIEDFANSRIVHEHMYILKEVKQKAKHLLDEKTEAIIASMQTTGSTAWLKYKDRLVSSLMVEMDDKEYPLTEVLNMAYSEDGKLRKKAYLAEIAAYPKIETGIASALNAIKGEVLTIAKIRGFASPLAQTLEESRLTQKTLDVLLEVIEESLPKFQDYLQMKAKALGHTNGLPFYDLYAPIVDVEMKYPYDKGTEFVIKQFGTFSTHLSEYAKKAINNAWIDVYPKKGKVGGAFCNNLHSIKQSRFLLNYGDHFGDTVTLGHELGHGFHGECLLEQTALNANYPMPIAETASTFCETIIKKAAIKEANEQETLSILESELSDCTQVIVDIYSRYLFESKVFEKRQEAALSVDEIKEIMLEAQQKAYGDGLDPKYLHPYMWTWKPHYYYADCFFYNFPYAFGLLLAKGLYAMYLQEGSDFAEKYEIFLSKTGSMSLEDVAKTIGVDLQDKEFWRQSMDMIFEDIDTFKELINNNVN